VELCWADVDAELIEWCRKMYPDARFEILRGDRLPFGNGEFDIVLASGVIQYIRDYITILSELHRISKGWILVSRLPLWKHSNSQIVVQHARHAWGEEHHPMHVLRADEMEALFEKLGSSILFHGSGSESYYVPGVSEPVVHNLYLLRKRASEP